MTGTNDLCRFIMLLLEEIGRNVDFKSFIRTLSLSLVSSVKTEWTPSAWNTLATASVGNKGLLIDPLAVK